MVEISAEIAEQLGRALGQAVVRNWSGLPHDVQQHLFEEVIKSEGESARSQLAGLLHDKHPRTFAVAKARDMPEPDSLGG